MPTRSTPERLDAAVETLLTGQHPIVEPELRPLVDAAASVRAALGPIPAGRSLELRLARRLGLGPAREGSAHEGVVGRAGGALADLTRLTRRGLAHPGRLLAAGAVSSAAVGVTVTAVAVWRSSRRHGMGSR